MKRGNSMKLYDILVTSAILLGKNDAIEYLGATSQNKDFETLVTVDNLTRAANIVISELAFTYIPMIKEERVQVENGKIKFEDLSEKILDLIGVYESEKAIKYKLRSDRIEVDATTVTVKYSYLPSNYDVHDEIGYKESEVSARILAYGVNSEYLLIEHAFEESLMWRDRYTKALERLVLPKSTKIKGRAWM